MRITGFSDIAASLLSDGGTGFVHSVYKDTVNIAIGGRLFSLQPECSAATPLSVMIGCTDLTGLELGRGDAVHICQHALKIVDRCVFRFDSDIVPFSTRIGESLGLTAGSLCRTVDAIEAVLQELSPRESICHAMIPGCSSLCVPFIEEERIILNQAGEQFSENDLPGTADALCKLIGLGPGLTPSGDDFITGILFALRLLPSEPAAKMISELQRVIAAVLHTTTDISGQFLLRASEGHFSLALLELADAAAGGEPVQIAGACRKIASFGHSSGCDTLTGILWMLQQIHSIERKDLW